MAIALVANVGTSNTNHVAGPSAEIDTTGANLIVILRSSGTGGPDPTDSKSNAWIGLTAKTFFGVEARLYYGVNPAVGAGHTVNNDDTGLFFPAIFAQAFSGGNGGFDTGKESNNSDIGTTIQPGSLTPSEDNCLIVTGVVAGADGTTFSIDSGFTLTNQIAKDGVTTFGGAFACKIQTTAAAVNPIWTASGSTDLRTVMAVFKSGGGVVSASFPPVDPMHAFRHLLVR